MIVDHGGIKRLVTTWRLTGCTVALTNGCFRILHVGHLATLAFASAQADRLIVLIDDDEGTRRLKGDPIVPAEQRALIVSCIRKVDAVMIFGDGELDSLIGAIRPDVLVKGEEYRGREIIGARHAKRVAFTAMTPGISTTGLIRLMTGQ